jgi:hypothetical protein
MKDLICFSLWGRKRCYIDGLLSNAEQCKAIYPNFEFTAIIHRDTYELLTDQERKVLGSNVFLVTLPPDWTGMFWRMLPILWSSSRYVLVRDADSLVTNRERLAVEEWINSGLPFHIMRDHPDHTRPIMGGMFGVNATEGQIRNRFKEIKHILLEHSINDKAGIDYYQTDQDFLETRIVPIINGKAFVHDSYYNGKEFPVPCRDGIFVGKRVFQ